jgi:AcrR family transcriptional regulator
MKLKQRREAISTRDRILIEAANHFADRGFHASSLREICRDADVNPSLLHYYFNSKSELFLEVVSSFRERLSVERNDALLRVSPKLQGRRRVRAIVQAYIAPHIRLCAEPDAENYVRITGRGTSQPIYPPEVRAPQPINVLRHEFVLALLDALPQASEESISAAFSLTVDLMLIAPVDTVYETLTGRRAWPEDPDALTDRLVEFCTAGIIAICKDKNLSAGGIS